MTLAQAVRQIRDSYGWSQAEFGEQFGHTQVWTHYIESGKRAPTLVDLQKLSGRYGLTLTQGFWTVAP